MSDCTKETDEPESRISSPSTPPSFNLSTVAEDFMAATVIIVGELSSWIYQVILRLNSGDTCCPVQAPVGVSLMPTIFREMVQFSTEKVSLISAITL